MDATQTTDISKEFAPWYRDRWSATARLAGHLLGDAAEGEDLAADVLLRVWSRWRDLGWPDNPDAYLRRAIGNVVASRLRQRAVERRALTRTTHAAGPEAPEATVVDRAEVEWLLDHLSAPERQTVTWFYLEDRSCADIARRTGLAPASVRSRLHRGRRQLAAAVTN